METGTKGSARLGFYIHRQQTILPGQDGDAMHPGDGVRFFYSSTVAKFRAIVSLDSNGVVSTYYPTPDGPPQRLEPALDAPLASSIELDDALGREVIYGLFCDAAPSRPELAEELARRGKIADHAGWTIVKLEWEKRPREYVSNVTSANHLPAHWRALLRSRRSCGTDLLV